MLKIINPAPAFVGAFTERKIEMADYFTNFSLIVPLPDEAAMQYVLDLAEQAFHIQMGDEMPDDFPASLREVIEDWRFMHDDGNRSPVMGRPKWPASRPAKGRDVRSIPDGASIRDLVEPCPGSRTSLHGSHEIQRLE